MANHKERKGIAVYAFAKKMRVSDNAVRSRIRNGRLAKAVHEDGSLDEELATALWNREPPARRKHLPVPLARRRAAIKEEGEHGKAEYEIKLERMEVALETEKIQLEKLRQTTVDREDVRQAARAFGRAHRDAMLNFAPRFGPAIAAKIGCDAASLIAALDAGMREALLETVGIPVPFHAPDDPSLKEDQA